MKILKSIEEKEALNYIKKAEKIAQNSTCERSKCGSIIVKDSNVLGAGFNSSPLELKNQKRCLNSKDIYDKKVTDKTCCIHAEQRAIFDALRRFDENIKGSRLYFVRLNDEDKKGYSGEPYCTICSKMALDTGISEFVLYKKEGICVYNTQEYNDLSYKYQQK
jgi:deoxycytidylate deaminase